MSTGRAAKFGLWLKCFPKLKIVKSLIIPKSIPRLEKYFIFFLQFNVYFILLDWLFLRVRVNFIKSNHRDCLLLNLRCRYR